VVSTAYQAPFDWGELELWHVGGEPRRIAGEIGRSSAVTFLDANEVLVADGNTFCRYDVAGTMSSEVKVGFWIDRLISLGADGVLAIGNELALVDPRTGAVRWAPPATGKPQRFVVARDGRRLVRLPGLVRTHAPQIAEAFVVGSDGSRTVFAPPDVDWGCGAWLDDDRVALSCARAVYCWDLGSGALALVDGGAADVTALAGAGARIVAGYSDGSIVELSAG